jgi:broad specificity phosphatase PhoE
MRRWILVLQICLLFIASYSVAADEITTILLVRHAEKTTVPADNPVLNEQGKSRAEDLIRILGNAGIQAIYTSQYDRTRLTAEPIAKNLSITIRQIDAQKTPELVKEVLSKNKGQTVLIVGHSNSIPEIIQAFGGPAMDEIDETQYDNLFVLTLCNSGARLLKLKYGSLGLS